MHSSCACNHYNALFGRVGLPLPLATFRRREVRRYIDQLVHSIGRCHNLPYQDIIRSYAGMKRKRYELAERQLQERGDKLLPEDARVNMFIKQEGIRYTKDKIEPDCRAIQFRSFEYTLYLASRIKVCEHKMFELEDVPGFGPGRIFAKNLTDLQCGTILREKWDNAGPGAKCLMLDLSRCDAHINNRLQEIEHAVFIRTNPDPGLRVALRKQLLNFGRFAVRTDTGWFTQKYRVRGQRMSGDSNTSGGTCIIVAVILAYFGNTFYPGKFSFMCNGDDSVFIFQGRDLKLEAISKFFLRFGLTVKVDGRTQVFEKIDFCQSRPILLPGGWTMVRNPEKIVTKLGFSNLGMPLARRAIYVRTVALGELSRLRGVPVLQEFLVSVIRSCEVVMQRGGLKRRLDMRAIRGNYRFGQYLPSDWATGRTLPITQEARQGYELAWGPTIGEQLSFESMLRSRSIVPTGTRCGRPIESDAVRLWDYDWERTEIV